MDNVETEANWHFRRTFLSSSPPSPPRQNQSSKEYRALNFFLSQYSADTFFSSNRAIWVPKNAEFYADSKSKDNIEKGHE